LEIPADRESGVPAKSDRMGSKPIDTKRVSDVIGNPESWPNYLHSGWLGPPDMRGAVITDVISSGNQIAIRTEGAACGDTFSVFVIEDQNLRERTLLALRPGTKVHEAVAATI